MSKKVLIFIVVLAIFAGCVQKRSSEKTILGLGTDYFIYPETLNGK